MHPARNQSGAPDRVSSRHAQSFDADDCHVNVAQISCAGGVGQEGPKYMGELAVRSVVRECDHPYARATALCRVLHGDWIRTSEGTEPAARE